MEQDRQRAGSLVETTIGTRFTRAKFTRFKAFRSFALHLRQFNILVGPNNSGKSTILTAFRILSAGMRRANARSPTLVSGPSGKRLGYAVDLSPISAGEENVFFDYDESVPATVSFTLSNGHELFLYFPERGTCYLFADAAGKPVRTPKAFREHFNCPIGFVPILGPVEHNEPLYDKEAARLALFNYRAARNFRNIWYHFPDRFEEFRETLRATWPGMDIEPPRADHSYDRTRLHMFCPEERIPRELFWSGFGFQVWCQMLTHLIQSGNVALFLIDEPDIYLHSDLQRQLLVLLRAMGSDVLIATHSVEIIAEAEADEIVLVNKRSSSSKRLRQPTQLGDIFVALGSNLNPVLTQLAKTRRVVFVEGKDFQILSRFAQKLGNRILANRSAFAVVPVDGFNPDRARSMKAAMELTLGTEISAALILDRDFRSPAEIEALQKECTKFAKFVAFHECKEVENYLLVAPAIDRATARRAKERASRSGKQAPAAVAAAGELLATFAANKQSYTSAQFVAARKRFERVNSPALDEATVIEAGLREFSQIWQEPLKVVPGKEALSWLNEQLQQQAGVTVTAAAIVDAMRVDEVPEELQMLLQGLAEFGRGRPGTADDALRPDEEFEG